MILKKLAHRLRPILYEVLCKGCRIRVTQTQIVSCADVSGMRRVKSSSCEQAGVALCCAKRFKSPTTLDRVTHGGALHLNLQ